MEESMPELPEVETTLRAIAPELINQTIEAIIIYQPKLRWPIPSQLKERCPLEVQRVTRRAKYLQIQTPLGTLIIHLGMSGHLRILPKNTSRQKHDHVDFILKGDTLIRYTDPRRFGAVLWTEQKLNEHPLFQKLGPEPLTRTFNARYLLKLLQNKTQPIKQCMMDQKSVVGVGNIYANEALFRAKIRPDRKANTLNHQECKLLVTATKNVLREAIKKGGTTLRDFRSPLNQQGYFRLDLDVYDREGKPCTQCSKPIDRLTLQQRSSFYCSSCQR